MCSQWKVPKKLIKKTEGQMSPALLFSQVFRFLSGLTTFTGSSEQLVHPTTVKYKGQMCLTTEKSKDFRPLINKYMTEFFFLLLWVTVWD